MEEVETKIAQNSYKYSWHLIGKVSHLLFWVRQRELMPYNILPRQAYILFLLYNLDHKATLDELSRLTDRKTGTLSIIISRMERDGLVKKIRENPRSVLLKYELTEKGVAAYQMLDGKQVWCQEAAKVVTPLVTAEGKLADGTQVFIRLQRAG